MEAWQKENLVRLPELDREEKQRSQARPVFWGYVSLNNGTITGTGTGGCYTHVIVFDTLVSVCINYGFYYFFPSVETGYLS